MSRFSIPIAFLCLLAVPSYHCDDDNPFLDLATSFLQNMGDGSNNNGMAALGSIMGSLMQGGGGNNAGDLLSSMGSLLGNGAGEGGPKLDPSLIGNMISMFAQTVASTELPPRQKRETKSKESDFNIDSILNLASGFMGSKDAASFLPVIMNFASSLSNTDTVRQAVDEHKDHASFLPPFLEKIHLYWDLFINSDLGKTVWEKSGLKKGLKAFTGPDGKISFELMFKSFENRSFRRHWIKAAAKYLTDFAVHFAKPEVYQKYAISAQYIINSFLDSQGMPKSAHFNSKKPEKSISVLTNYVLKKYLDIDTDVTEYVKPAVEYAKQTLKMAEKTTKNMSSRGDYSALADRLTDTLNLEIIEPVLRVYRAYKHSVSAPHCQEHLMCLVNKHPDQGKPGLPGFKAGLTKLTSLAASAALSFQNGKSFWDLYNAVQNDKNCEAAYPADCSSFHEHELKVTTEVYHSEL